MFGGICGGIRRVRNSFSRFWDTLSICVYILKYIYTYMWMFFGVKHNTILSNSLHQKILKNIHFSVDFSRNVINCLFLIRTISKIIDMTTLHSNNVLRTAEMEVSGTMTLNSIRFYWQYCTPSIC